MTRIELPPTWAPIPHELISDPAVGDSAVRLYALLHKLGWERREIADIHDLAALWPAPPGERAPAERSLYRWLNQLEDAGWLTYTRRPGQRGLGDRLRLYPEPLTPESEALTPESEDGRTPDTRVRGDDPPLTPESEPSDTRVRGSHDLPRPDAPNHAPQIRTQIPKTHESSSTTTTPLPPTNDSGGGGGERETLAILQQAGVVTAAEYTDIPPAVAEAAIAQSRTHKDAGRRLGNLVVGLLKRYRARTWAPPPPQPEEVPDAPPDRPARRSGARPPAAERPAGSGPPPGVRTPTAEDLTAWGIGPGRPWPRE